jgi:hypothetical protein
VTVLPPDFGGGLDYFSLHRTTDVTWAAVGVPPTVTIDFSAGDPRYFVINGSQYFLSSDYNVVKAIGVNVILLGDTSWGRPMVLASLADAGGNGGNVQVKGSFSPYVRIDPGPVYVNQPGAFAYKDNGTWSRVHLAVLAENDISFEDNPALPQELVGYFFAQQKLNLTGAARAINVLGTFHGMISGGPLITLQVAADPGLAVHIPRGFPRRPAIAQINFSKGIY